MPPLHERNTVPAADPPNFGEIPVGEALAGKSRRARRVGRGDGDTVSKGVRLRIVRSRGEVFVRFSPGAATMGPSRSMSAQGPRAAPVRTDATDSVIGWIRGLGTSRHEDASRRLWDRYFGRLARLVRGRLPAGAGGPVDGEAFRHPGFQVFQTPMLPRALRHPCSRWSNWCQFNFRRRN
jgi:hypothetical protein